jgi:RNA polymerase sigma-70 factor (ECF subfamily)
MRGSAELDGALESARAGEARGYEALFNALGASVAAYLRARSVSDPDDLANEVFLRAFRTLGTFRGDGERFRSWLFTIAHHAAIDDKRRRNRRVTEVPLSATYEPPHGDVEAEVFEVVGRERVRNLLDQLSPDQRDVLLLRVVGDLTAEQTAAALDKSYEAVKALQRRGLATLRRLLAAAGEEADNRFRPPPQAADQQQGVPQ